MNRDETKKAIEVMQAFIDGVEIECRWSSQVKWTEFQLTQPSWNFRANEYRIKPQEPREFLLYPIRDNNRKWGVEENTEIKGWSGAIKVREVL